jgi:hypothetical protein
MNSTDGETVTSLYCDRAGTIIPLDDGFCRACSAQADEHDGTHHRPTPELLKREGYFSTPVPDTEAQGNE